MTYNNFWIDSTYGEVYVVKTGILGEVLSATGPLHHSEISAANLTSEDWAWDTEVGEWIAAHADDYHLLSQMAANY